ncbi:homoserine O-succinyltransferase MetX [Lysobacter sp. F6437]|uniref:homoserine O-succinyltransferase MetX n=1 Tax=Lysobacter sp. F6437 TaxID=3459296 RepID=UPI00403DABA2
MSLQASFASRPTFDPVPGHSLAGASPGRHPPSVPGAARDTVPAVRGEVRVDLALRHAGRRTVALRYERVGDPSLPVVFVAGGISADRHVGANDASTDGGWWNAQVGPGRALDPQRHCLLAFDWVGSDGSLDVALDPADQADAIAALVDALGIVRLHSFVGCSYGAMVGLQFAALHPSRLRQLVAISGVHRAHPYASAWRALQRRAVALGALQCDDSHGLELARQLAILSYRSPEEFDGRFDAAEVLDGRVRVGAEDYLDYCGARYASRTSPTAFVRLSESIDLQALQPESVRLPVTVVAVEGDRVVPIGDSRELVERLGGGTRLHVLESIFGHDAFLKETAAIGGILVEALGDAKVAA